MNFLIIILFTILYPFNLEIQPSAYIEYYTNGGEFSLESHPITFMGWSINTNYENNNFNIETSFSAHGINGYTPKYNDLNQRQGIPYLVNYMDNYEDLGIYWTSVVNIKYKKENLLFEIGNKNRNLGSGINSIFISNKATNYPTIAFDWQISSSLDYNYFYAFLNQSDNAIDNYRFYSYKSMATHQVNYNFSDKFIFSLYESVIFDRYMDINYLNPFVLYYPLSRYMGYNDNNQIGFELVFKLNQSQKYHFSLLVDEWDPDLTFEKYHQNWMAYQIGSQLVNLLSQNDKFNFEYTWTDYRVYENSNEDMNFYLEGYPLGYWAGGHSRVFYLDYQRKILNLNIKLSFLDVKKGISPENLIEIAYNKINFDRYSLGFEQKKQYSVVLEYYIKNKLIIGLKFNYLEWINNSINETNILYRSNVGINLSYQLNYLFSTK